MPRLIADLITERRYESFMILIDDFFTNYPHVEYKEKKWYQKALQSHQYFNIASEIKKNVLLPTHPIYYFGISDSWGVWQSYITLMSVDQDVIHKIHLLTDDWRNVKSWFFLSGSDDCAWAGLGLLDLFNKTGIGTFLNMHAKWYGAKGAKQLWEKALVYVEENGSIYWNADRNYKPTVSANLWILWSLRMFRLTGHKRYFFHGMKTYKWMFSKKLIENGKIYDGIDSI